MNKAVINAFIDSEDFSKESEWFSFHDCLVNAYWGVEGKNEFTLDDCKDEFRKLSSCTQGIAIQWGLSDTVFRDEAYVEIRKREGIIKTITMRGN